MLSDGPPSIVAALSGLLVGYLYETDGYGFQNWRLPRFIEVTFSIILVLYSIILYIVSLLYLLFLYFNAILVYI